MILKYLSCLNKVKFNHLGNIVVYYKGVIVMSEKIGVINEIGDMGLGFDELSESDQKKLEEEQKKEQEKQQRNTASK